MLPIEGRMRAAVVSLPVLLLLVFAAGCGVPQVLTPALPESAGTVSVGSSLSQPFLSPTNGLDGVTVAISPPLGSDGELLPQPTGGATLTVRLAPQADDRFPEEPFHDWPATDKWLGELTRDQSEGQSFLSRYPNLDGITLRVATYGADTGTGEGTLLSGPSIDVLSLPLDGQLVTSVPGGSSVKVLGSAEGWAHVQLDNGQGGYVALDDFSHLPPAARHNSHGVILTLYRESDMTQVRQTTINASQLHDNSHVTFPFAPIANSDGQRYRFVITSPDSTPGNAVTFRYAPSSNYSEGQRFENGQAVGGAIVFKPVFGNSSPIYQGNVDTFGWSTLTNAFIASFPTINGTADRFLSVDLTPGTRPLNVKWSLSRPSGGTPMIVDGNSRTPGGGLVFDVRYRDNVSLSHILSESARTVWRDARGDPPFFGFYLFMIVGVISWGGWFGVRRLFHGR